jgi:hypothetical protein
LEDWLSALLLLPLNVTLGIYQIPALFNDDFRAPEIRDPAIIFVWQIRIRR